MPATPAPTTQTSAWASLVKDRCPGTLAVAIQTEADCSRAGSALVRLRRQGSSMPRARCRPSGFAAGPGCTRRTQQVDPHRCVQTPYLSAAIGERVRSRRRGWASVLETGGPAELL